jgi:LuxR family maltose regulon positive regulatory protein
MLGLVFVLTLSGDVLLREGADRGGAMLDEARQLIERCPDPGITLPLLDRVTARHRVAGSRPPATTGLVEQLSERELAVLRYLPSALSLPEIARELYVSPNTVKTQCSAIYRKLGWPGARCRSRASADCSDLQSCRKCHR